MVTGSSDFNKLFITLKLLTTLIFQIPFWKYSSVFVDIRLLPMQKFNYAGRHFFFVEKLIGLACSVRLPVGYLIVGLFPHGEQVNHF